TFELTEASVETSGATTTVHVAVRNTGARSGTDVVQIYCADPARLVAFARVEVEPNETREVELEIPHDRFAVRDLQRHPMVVRPGRYSLRAARDATDPGIALEVDVEVS